MILWKICLPIVKRVRRKRFNSISLPTSVALIAISAAELTYVWPSSRVRSGDWRLSLVQFFAPLLIFSLFPLWSWHTVESQARVDADRTLAWASQYAQRVFEIQGTALEAVLRHLKGAMEPMLQPTGPSMNSCRRSKNKPRPPAPSS